MRVMPSYITQLPRLMVSDTQLPRLMVSDTQLPRLMVSDLFCFCAWVCLDETTCIPYKYIKYIKYIIVWPAGADVSSQILFIFGRGSGDKGIHFFKCVCIVHKYMVLFTLYSCHLRLAEREHARQGRRCME